ncbi:polysaccharide deacetylase family protein [Paenibacillus sp. J31TS4]|uniref:polysaccharide deacetylase family protein n=1 Tax=Paenibacillus sp. J31TS4 TaxID=2807195 RepID=UPI001BCCE3E9|nr:polysaccharide deacetylase family protein [Paenibacillus sp. J31TS4]
MSQGFDDWFVTVKEFNAILESLYKNDYMLVDIRTVAQEERELQMPEGKKPLILSVDDINYYDYMLGNGTVSKLIVDAKGRIATVSKDRDGTERVGYDNEFVPIIDTFVREHPDFSLNGAKGMLNVTGYEGILGYRTNLLQAEDYEETRSQAIRVAEALKAEGWSFASHGWGHLDARKISLERLIQDTNRWKKEVEPLVGATSVYVFPYGSSVLPGDRKFQALLDAGFHVLCSVGPDPYLRRTPEYMLMDRRHIDGVALRGQAKRLAGLFDAKAVIDPIRPKLP